MRTQQIIESITDSLKFAHGLDAVCGISVKPGDKTDIAALTVLANRLSEQLGATQRLIAREISTMRGTVPATAGRNDDDVIAMLMRSQESGQ